MNEIILAPCDVISKIKQNSSDMNKIIQAPCDFISKIKQNSSDMNEIILASCDAGYVQNCTGYFRAPICPTRLSRRQSRILTRKKRWS
jgi:hypothetical protein